MLKQGFLFGVGLIGALVVAFVGYNVGVAVIGGVQTGRNEYNQSEAVKPTLQGLRSVVIGRKYDCLDTATNSMKELSVGRWRLNCPAESYVITLNTRWRCRQCAPAFSRLSPSS